MLTVRDVIQTAELANIQKLTWLLERFEQALEESTLFELRIQNWTEERFHRHLCQSAFKRFGGVVTSKTYTILQEEIELTCEQKEINETSIAELIDGVVHYVWEYYDRTERFNVWMLDLDGKRRGQPGAALPFHLWRAREHAE